MKKSKSTLLIFLLLMTITTSLLFFKSSNVIASTDIDPDPDVTPFENAYWDFDEGDVFAWETKESIDEDDVASRIYKDSFSTSNLGDGWSFYNEISSKWSLSDRPGYMRIIPESYVDTGNNLTAGYWGNLLLRDAPIGDFELETELEFSPNSNAAHAGLIIYVSNTSYISFATAYNTALDPSGRILHTESDSPDGYTAANVQFEANSLTHIFLKLQKNDNMIKFFYSSDGESWSEFTSGVEWSPAAGDMKVGIRVWNGNSGPHVSADFNYFDIYEQGDYEEDFSTSNLGDGWSFYNEIPSKWSLTDRPGYMRIIPESYVDSGNNLTAGYWGNLLLRDAPTGDFEIMTELDFSPNSNAAHAGLIIYVSNTSYISFATAYNTALDPSGRILHTESDSLNGYIAANVQNEANSLTHIFLKLQKSDNLIRFFYSADGESWSEFTSGVSWSPAAGDMKIGLRVWNGHSGPHGPADFNVFGIYEPKGYLEKFSTSSLGDGWTFYNEIPSKWSLTDRPGYMRIIPESYVDSGSNLTAGYWGNLLLRDAPSGDFELMTELEFSPNSNAAHAGLIIYVSNTSYISFATAYNTALDPSGRVLHTESDSLNGYSGANVQYQANSLTHIFLKLQRIDNIIRLLYSKDGESWSVFTSSSWIPAAGDVKVGLRVWNGNSGPHIPADFNSFSIREKVALYSSPMEIESYIEASRDTPPDIYNVSKFTYELMKQHAPEVGFEIGAEFVWNVTILNEFLMYKWFEETNPEIAPWESWFFTNLSQGFLGSDPCAPAPLINYNGDPDNLNKKMKLVVQEINHIDDDHWQVDVDTWNWTTGTFGVDPDIDDVPQYIYDYGQKIRAPSIWFCPRPIDKFLKNINYVAGNERWQIDGNRVWAEMVDDSHPNGFGLNLTLIYDAETGALETLQLDNSTYGIIYQIKLISSPAPVDEYFYGVKLKPMFWNASINGLQEVADEDSEELGVAVNFTNSKIFSSFTEDIPMFLPKNNSGVLALHWMAEAIDQLEGLSDSEVNVDLASHKIHYYRYSNYMGVDSEIEMTFIYNDKGVLETYEIIESENGFSEKTNITRVYDLCPVDDIEWAVEKGDVLYLGVEVDEFKIDIVDIINYTTFDGFTWQVVLANISIWNASLQQWQKILCPDPISAPHHYIGAASEYFYPESDFERSYIYRAKLFLIFPIGTTGYDIAYHVLSSMLINDVSNYDVVEYGDFWWYIEDSSTGNFNNYTYSTNGIINHVYEEFITESYSIDEGIGIQGGDEFTWEVTTLNIAGLQAVFGTNWEQMAIDVLQKPIYWAGEGWDYNDKPDVLNEEMKIRIESVGSVESENDEWIFDGWELGFDIWNWTTGSLGEVPAMNDVENLILAESEYVYAPPMWFCPRFDTNDDDVYTVDEALDEFNYFYNWETNGNIIRVDLQSWNPLYQKYAANVTVIYDQTTGAIQSYQIHDGSDTLIYEIQLTSYINTPEEQYIFYDITYPFVAYYKDVSSYMSGTHQISTDISGVGEDFEITVDVELTGETDISILGFEENPSDEFIDDAELYLDLFISNVSNVVFPINLTIEISATLAASGKEIKIYHFNTTSETWEELNHTVDGTTITITLEHASLFSITASEVLTPTPPPSDEGGGGGGGGGGGSGGKKISGTIPGYNILILGGLVVILVLVIIIKSKKSISL
jgi:beta-xylosidase